MITLPTFSPTRLLQDITEWSRRVAQALNNHESQIDALIAGGGGGGGTADAWTETEVDFGTTPVFDAQFTITDAAITSSSKINVLPCGKAATGRTADDWQFDGAVFAANPASGSATCYATFIPGPIVGKRKIQYLVR